MTSTKSKTPRQRGQVLNLETPEAQALRAGIVSPATGASEDANAADQDNAVSNHSAALGVTVEAFGRTRRIVQSDKTLSDLGRRQRLDQLGAAAYQEIIGRTEPVVKSLAARIRQAKDKFGAVGSQLSGAEAVRHLARGVTTGFGDAAGQLRLAGLTLTAKHLLRMADQPSKASELLELLHDGAQAGDIALWAALDVLMTPTLRNRVLAAANLSANPQQVEAMRRTLRAALDPEGAAQVAALHELGRLVVSNARSAVSMIDASGYRVEPGQERLEQLLERVLQPLTAELQGLADVPRSPAPSLDPN